MTFEVSILGSNSAIPSHGRHPTSQVVGIHDKLFLVDCGEGAQIQMSRYKVKFGKIDTIFISHLHGDHFFGLIGLITSYHLNQRDKPLTIYSNKGIEEIIMTQLKFSSTKLNYPLIFKDFVPEMGNVIYEDKSVTVETVVMKHRIPCAGFIFREKRPHERNMIKEKISEHNIPVSKIPEIKNGKDFITADGKIIPNSELTTELHEPRAYAYCTDTAYNEDIIPYIKNVDLLYHEATFDQSNIERAVETNHSTTVQAAAIAKKADVGQLLIGHFSARYHDLDDLVNEARTVFPNSHLAIEGTTFAVAEKKLVAL